MGLVAPGGTARGRAAVTEGPPVPEAMAPSPAGAIGRTSGQIMRWARVLFLVAIPVALAAQFALAGRLTINWDEFNYLTIVYERTRAALVMPLQSFHAWLFAWLPWSGETEIDEIVSGRLVMAVLICCSAALTYRLARIFVDTTAALFATLLYVASDAVLLHGASFRYDPLATVLCLAAMTLVLRRSPVSLLDAALAGAIMALAAMTTVKVAFYLVSIGLGLLYPILVGRPRWRRDALVPILAFGILFLGGFTVLYLVHAAAIGGPSAGGAVAAGGSVAEFLARIAERMFVDDGLFARWRSLLASLLFNPHLWLMTIWGAAIAVRRLRRADLAPPARRNAWFVLAFAVPVLTPLFYRNAFDYYFVFILPPAVCLAAIAFERLCDMARKRRDLLPHALLGLVLLLPCLLLVRTIAIGWPDRMAPQRAVVAAVHAIFPMPVPYIDGYGVIARFQRVGFFHSTWGVDNYRKAGRPVYADLVAATQPPLLLADSPSLFGAMTPGIEMKETRALLPGDAAFLAAHYLPYWGMIVVAGQHLSVAGPGDRLGFDIVVAGDYRIDADGGVGIDGAFLEPGAVVALTIGPHEFVAGPDAREATLIWADLGPVPDAPPVGLLEFFAGVR